MDGPSRAAAGPFSGPITRADVVARIEAHALGETPEAMRDGFERLVLGDARDPYDPASPGDARTVGNLHVAARTWGVEGLVVMPPDADASHVLIWLHGGGYVFGSPETHLRPAATVAGRLGVEVFLPRYRRAPEDAWPAPLDDALACIRAAQRAGRRVLLAGDSAGGHLALVAALEAARDASPVDALALFSPNTDRTGLSPTRQAHDPLDPMVDDEGDRALAAMTFGERPASDPHVSPALSNLRALPPTHLEVGDPEVLLGDSVLLHERARAAEADVTLHVEGGLLHMGQLWAPWWPAAAASLDRACTHLARFLG